MALPTNEIRQQFFDWIYGEAEGFICIATASEPEPRQSFKQKFFHWPSEKENIYEFVESVSIDRHVWFSVNLFSQRRRLKEYALKHDIVWADLDEADPAEINPPPTIVIRSSRKRFQALWKLEEPVPPDIAEDYSKRIAYLYQTEGADPTGWDLTQILRVPLTQNLKYEERPRVEIIASGSESLPLELFENLPPAPVKEADDIQFHDVPQDVPEAEEVITKYRHYLSDSFVELYEIQPELADDWSARMWKLINLAFEAGMEREEVFSIALKAKCNKYERDRRPMRYLWREVLKAQTVQDKIDVIAGTWEPLLMPELVQPEDWAEEDTFLDDYKRWASQATDAVYDYHELAAAILLSATLGGFLRLEANYGTVVPNLWGLILGESTLTRKTTAMKMAIDMLHEVDREALLATDGSAEGLLTGLSTRPNRVSVYYKDEVSGFFDSINRKDYLAGLPETLTQLYDVPRRYTRILRKETISIESPVFIFFGGGIRDKVYSLINDEYILSGFLPRFLVVSGVADLSQIRQTGPKSAAGFASQQKLLNTLEAIKDVYASKPTAMKIGGQLIEVDLGHAGTEVILTDKSWELYGAMETKMVKAAHASSQSMLALPTFERLSRSLLKLTMLIAATRQEPTGGFITAEERDVIHAARFIQRWGKYSVELVVNAGKTVHLRTMEKVRDLINRKPGIYKSEVMRFHHLSSREINDVLSTLIDRGEIRRQVKGRSERLWTI